MVKQEFVSTLWQCFFMIIPIVNFWAAWRIEKLRLFLIINMAIFLCGSIVIEIFFPGELLGDGPLSDEADQLNFAIWIIGIIIDIIIIRKWSNEWNTKLSVTS